MLLKRYIKKVNLNNKKECDSILLLIIKYLYDEIQANFPDRNETIKLVIEMSKIIKE